MRITIFCLLILSGLLPSDFFAQTMTAELLLEKSRNYHDPAGKMMKKKIGLTLNEPRPGGPDRISELVFDPAQNYFSVNRKTEEATAFMANDNGKAIFLLNGASEVSEKDREKHRLTEQRLKVMQQYYHYLWFLPMKLQDQGTIIDPKVESTDFFGKAALQVRVTYDPEVGKDIWYFYFHPISYALIGYRFYHDESKNDGEYILLEGETKKGNVRIPKMRKWYKHSDGEYLGMDELLEIKVGKVK